MKSVRYLISKTTWVRPVGMLAAVVFCLMLAQYAQAADAQGGKPDKSIRSNVLGYRQGMKISEEIAGRPASDKIEVSGGRSITVGEIREKRDILMKLRQPRGNRKPAGLKLIPAGSGAKIETAEDVAAALKRPDTDTIQLPSGKTVTVGKLKFIKPYIERVLGRSIDVAPTQTSVKKPVFVGPATKVDSKTDWDKIQKLPEDTILESPHGKRFTVGMLKKVLAKNPTLISDFRQKSIRPSSGPIKK